MKLIFEAKELGSIEDVGGKGHHLQKLVSWRANVAPFFVVSTSAFNEFQKTGQIPDLVKARFREFLSRYPTVALRSSMIGEDHLDASFAGMFETLLGVTNKDWEEGLKKIYASMASGRVKQYIEAKKIQNELKMAVVVQEEIRVEKSGVLFTRAPLTPTSLVAIDAAYGMGEGVVSGHVDVDHYLMTRMGEIVQGSEGKVLTEPELKNLFEESLRLEKIFVKPADIEWGIRKGELFIFQIRPITREFEKLKVFADTNLSESYPGSVSPFTARFVRKAYENVFLEAANIIGIKGERLEMLKIHCSQLIADVDDHLYYNLEHYYAALRALPGGEKNIENWHKMIGGKVEGAEVPFHDTYLSHIGLASSIFSLGGLALKRKSVYPQFLKDLDKLASDINSDMQTLKNPQETIRYLGQLLERPLGFGVTIINDFYIMLGLGVLTSSLKKKGLPDDTVIDLLRTTKGLDSVKPLQAFDDLLKNLSQKFLDDFDRIDTPDGLDPFKSAFIQLEDQCHTKDVALLRSFLNEYGDRSFEELKLESLPLKNDPNLLKKLIKWGRDNKSEVKQTKHNVTNFDANPLDKLMIHFTRDCIEFRESSRLWRGRFYHFLRQLVIKLAEQLHAEDPGWTKFGLKDFFSINHLEWAQYSKGELSKDRIQELMRTRDWRTKQQVYPEFLVWAPSEKLPHMTQQFGTSSALKGQGVSPGVKKARALVLENPTEILDAHLEEFILVTRNTDPAWVYIMSRSQGLISEKGSMLSHTAIIGRELGVPTIVGVKGATHQIKTGDLISIDGTSGEVTIL